MKHLDQAGPALNVSSAFGANGQMFAPYCAELCVSVSAVPCCCKNVGCWQHIGVLALLWTVLVTSVGPHHQFPVNCQLSWGNKFYTTHFGVNGPGSRGEENPSNQVGVNTSEVTPARCATLGSESSSCNCFSLGGCFSSFFCVPSPPRGSAFQAGPVV